MIQLNTTSFISILLFLLISSDYMPEKVFVIGAGMSKFMKPSEENPDYPEFSKIAVTRALMDSQINYE